MHADTSVFIHSLFEHCSIENECAFLTLSAIHPDGEHPTPSRHIPLGNEKGLLTAIDELLAANERGWGAYVGIATRQGRLGRWSRGCKDNLGVLPALFVDIDDPDCALWRLIFFDLPCSIIVHSGRGYHAYWILDKPTTDFVTADLRLRGLAYHLGGDPVLSVAHSMRLPGTINTKPGREGSLCQIVHYDPDCRYVLSDFTPFEPPPDPPIDPQRWHVELSFVADREHTIEAVTEAVIHCLDGRPRHNGFIAARCPLPHAKDRPGMHFSYHARSGMGFCFGKHGKIPLQEMCKLMGVWN